MFAKCEVLLPEKINPLFIPGDGGRLRALRRFRFRDREEKGRKDGRDSLMLRQQFIRTGETRGDFVAVTEGS